MNSLQKKKKISLRMPIPPQSVVYAEKGDKTINLLLYEVDQLEEIEVIDIKGIEGIQYKVKNGQFVKKGTILFTHGFMNHKQMRAEHNGIIEIKTDTCTILGQKKHFERRIHVTGEVKRVVPRKFIEIAFESQPIKPVYYNSRNSFLSNQVYLHTKEEIGSDSFKTFSPDSAVYVNDNLRSTEIAKLITLGARRIIVNGLITDDLVAMKSELGKLEGFAVLGGFGELVSKKYTPISPRMSILWGKKNIFICDHLTTSESRVFEHPFWGISGRWNKKNELIGEFEYNNERIEFYLKNLAV